MKKTLLHFISPLFLSIFFLISLVTMGASCTTNNTTANENNANNANTAPANTTVVNNNQKIEIQVIIDNGTAKQEYKANLKQNSTVDQAMRQVSADNQFSYVTSESTGTGIFVEEIAGVKSDAAASKYWLFSINGTAATVGVAEAMIANGDIIEWKYQAF